MALQNLEIVLAERPTGDIIPGRTFKQKTSAAPTENDLQDGEVLVENLFMSLDPAMRGFLDDTRSYWPPVQIGERMRALTVSRVLASKSTKVSKGDIIPVPAGWAEYSIIAAQDVPDASAFPEVTNPADYLSSLGITALTAYFGILRIGDPKAGETVVISGAAGATGSVAGQIAKIRGARVIGIAGSDEKCRWLTEELGFDVAINYKNADYIAKLEEATPDFIDIFFDNVGGTILDSALARANPHARFVLSGNISQYNSSTPQQFLHFTKVITLRLKMQGFIILDYSDEFRAAREQLIRWLDEGKIQRKETVVRGGLAVAEQALVDLYKGVNTGKLLVEIKEDKAIKL
ncbi:nadp-dependent leukotriene b4 12-hydroxydehydrogenase [Colletotrichum tabaci]|uniref:Dehydrogenase FUB6 n=1 Tax=Colletotrichum tabaci TaxID=1209068 RepID=A0AAV9T027_9PEZI